MTQVFCLKSQEYFEIGEGSLNDHNDLSKSLPLLSLYSPLIINVKNNIEILTQVLKLFEKNSEFILENIHFQKNNEIDSLYRIFKDLLLINLNFLNYSKKFKLKKLSIRILFLKRIIISYVAEDLCSNKERDPISKIMIENFEFKLIDNIQEYYVKNKKGIKRKYFYDDNQIEELSNNYKNFLLEQNLIKTNFSDENKISENEKTKDSKISQIISAQLKKEESILNNYKSSKSSFNFTNFYIILFTSLLTNLDKYIDEVSLEGEVFKEKYLDISKQEIKKFYQNLLAYEEKIYAILEEINKKNIFIENLMPRIDNNKELEKICSIILMPNEMLSNNSNEKFIAAVQGFSGKLKDMRLKVQKQLTVIDMIKKTIKILIDDNKYMNLKEINYSLLIMTIIQYCALQGFCLTAWYSVNIKIPLQEFENIYPFLFIMFLIVAIPLGQLYIFYKFKNHIM